MKKPYIVVIDCQQDFMQPDGALYIPGAEKLIKPINHYLLEHYTNDSCSGIIVTLDSHFTEDYKNSAEAKEFPMHCEVASKGWRSAIPCLNEDKIKYDIIMKSTIDMWSSENIFQYIGIDIKNADENDEYLIKDYFEELKEKGFTEIIVIGVAADYCVKYAVEGFVKMGFHVRVPEHLTLGINKQIAQVMNELEVEING